MTEMRWAKHYMNVWEERAGDPRLPLWFRATALAYGMHRANGHAAFTRGVRGHPSDIALILGCIDAVSGELTPATRYAVHRAIDTAVSFGLLGCGSNTSCLIVPAHAVSMGLGNALERCPVSHVKAAAKHSRQAAEIGA